MAKVTVTIRPGKRTEIAGLPFLPDGGNYELLAECIGASKRGQVKYDHGTWSVARSHTRSLVHGLVEAFEQVTVVQHGGTEQCVEACWNANPRTALTCECACAGGNHGTRTPLGKIVSPGGASGAVSVATVPPRIYVVTLSDL